MPQKSKSGFEAPDFDYANVILIFCFSYRLAKKGFIYDKIYFRNFYESRCGNANRNL